MKAKRTLVFAILFLTTLACGLVPAQAAPAGAGGCAWQAPVQAAPAPVTSQAGLQAAPVPLTRTGSGLECVSFCSIALPACPPPPGEDPARLGQRWGSGLSLG